jgi:S1-C subfamily serine protease
MKKLLFLTTLLIQTVVVNAQCLEERVKYEEYYEKNISNLNPLEGFWSVSFTAKLYLNGELVNTNSQSQASERAIIKDGSSFLACHKYGGYPSPEVIVFTPTLNPNIFLYKKTMNGEVTTANAVMTSIGLLEYSYETGQTELKSVYKEKYQNGLREYREFKWIKTYPTQEMFQTKQKSSGTGFAISTNGIIVTCNHVIENADKIIVKGINNDFNKTYKAKIISIDKNNDLAIIQIDDSTFKSIANIPFVIGDKTIEVGSSVFALGYPLRSSMGDEIKLTNGIISSKSGFQGDITAYQISVPVQPGNSGGPLFDDNGNLVGIINAKHLMAENASYAIKASYLRNLLESLSTTPKLSTVNSLAVKTLPDKVKLLKNFTYIIETN